MMNTSRLPRRPQPYRFASGCVLGLAMLVSGLSSLGRVDGIVSAQALNPCALLMVDEIEPLAANESVADGVSNSVASYGYLACRYSWGVGVDRFKLDVVVNDASRMFPGMSPDQIKQRLLESVRAGTADAVVPEVGEAAVFKPDSPVYAVATALVKGRILEVHLDGLFAPDRKDQVIELLKSAAARL
jgi:hypothetical protein